MYYFLAIIKDDDICKGRFEPSFTLCQAHGTSETRSGWRVVKSNSSMSNMNKVLTTSLIGNDTMIDFLCSYRTRDHMHGDPKYTVEQTRKYYPKGGLFWFPCNIYGRREGPALFIQRVPVFRSKELVDQGLQRLRETQATRPLFSTIFSREPACIDLETSHRTLHFAKG